MGFVQYTNCQPIELFLFFFFLFRRFSSTGLVACSVRLIFLSVVSPTRKHPEHTHINAKVKTHDNDTYIYICSTSGSHPTLFCAGFLRHALMFTGATRENRRACSVCCSQSIFDSVPVSACPRALGDCSLSSSSSLLRFCVAVCVVIFCWFVAVMLSTLERSCVLFRDRARKRNLHAHPSRAARCANDIHML